MNCETHESIFLRFRNKSNYVVWHNIDELKFQPHICIILKVQCWIINLLFSFLVQHCVFSDNRVCFFKIFHLYAKLLNSLLECVSCFYEVSRFLIKNLSCMWDILFTRINTVALCLQYIFTTSFNITSGIIEESLTVPLYFSIFLSTTSVFTVLSTCPFFLLFIHDAAVDIILNIRKIIFTTVLVLEIDVALNFRFRIVDIRGHLTISCQPCLHF